MKKAYQVKKFILESGVRFDRHALPESDAAAEELVDIVIEGDFNVTTQWEEAFTHFKHYFAGYMKNAREEQVEYDRMYS